MIDDFPNNTETHIMKIIIRNDEINNFTNMNLKKFPDYLL